MAKVRSVETKPELTVRAAAALLVQKFQTNCRDLPGCPDIVLRRRRKVVFVHGCFWHSHHCRAGQNVPVTRKAYWEKKRQGNARRDGRMKRQLWRDGWSVLTLWECELKNADRLKQKLATFLRKPRRRRK